MKRIKVKLKQTEKVKEYNEALRRGLQNRHVLRKNGAWQVKKAGAKRVSKVFDTQSEAINWAKSKSLNNTSVVVHARDGRVRKVFR